MVVPSIHHPLTALQFYDLCSSINPLRYSSNFGIDTYLRVLDFVTLLSFVYIYNQFAKTISSMHCNIQHQDQATQDSILPILDAKKKRAFRHSIDGNTSAWLEVLPLCTHHFDLRSATEFQDALAMRYHAASFA